MFIEKKKLRHILTTITALDDTEEKNRIMSGHTFSSQTFQQLIILKRKVLTFFSYKLLYASTKFLIR